VSDTAINIIYLLVVILAPIFPAFLLFMIKGLQSTANASGPYKGMAIKVGGAFGGYFIVFFILVFKLPNEFASAKKSEWRVNATNDTAAKFTGSRTIHLGTMKLNLAKKEATIP
jgi:uncharacterized membrane protein